MRRLSLGLALVAAVILGLTSVVTPASAGGRVVDRAGSRVSYRVDGAGRILVTARARACQGLPVLRIKVDGKVDRTVRMQRGGAHVYRSDRRYRRGQHVVTLVMLADRTVRRGSHPCDRRIRILRVSTSRPGPVRPRGPDRSFTLAVIGDTQSEVFPGHSTFAARMAWLVAHRAPLDLAFVAQTGDLVNWGWLAPSQYDIAMAAMSRLTAAGIPWQAAVGNHDTEAVGWDGIAGSRGYGGSAYAYNPECPQRLGAAKCKTKLLLRNTDAFGARVTSSAEQAVAGTFQGKVDNSYSRFTAAGRSWLVLSLELWPRQAALSWAAHVLASHPHDNVVILTHSYLLPDGSIGRDGEYGSLPATEIYRQLVVPFRNVKLVFSGHAGVTARRVDVLPGHKVLSFLGNETGGVGVTRLVEIHPDRGVVLTRWWSGTADLRSRPTGSTADPGLSFE